MMARDRPGAGRGIRHLAEAGKERYAGPSAEYLWRRLEAVFSAVFSGMVISDDDKYGPITIGVVIILGAVAGIVWHERGLSARRPRVAAGPDR